MAFDTDIVGVLSPVKDTDRVVTDEERVEFINKIRAKLKEVDADKNSVDREIELLEKLNVRVLEAFDFLLDFDKKLDGETGKYVQNTRKSGEIYAYHPLEVLRILVDEFKFDSKDERYTDLFIATILHDTYEDELEGKGRQFWNEDGVKLLHMIKSKFNSDGVLLRLDGVSKFKKDGVVYDQETYDNVMRVALVYPDILKLKLADRLHNWRTIKSMSLQKKLESARETKEFFLPIAERLGMRKVIDEFNRHIDTVLKELEIYNSDPKHESKLEANFENMYDISPWWPRIAEIKDSSPNSFNINDLYVVE